MTELVHSLGIEWPILLAQVVNFAILLAILGKFIYKPVMRLLDERKEGVAKALEREEKATAKLAAADSDGEAILAQARLESQKLIDGAKNDGEAIKRKMLTEAQQDTLRLRTEAEKRLAGERAKLVADVRRDIGAVVVEAIERSFSDVLDSRAQGKMVEQALAAIREDAKSGKNH